DLLGPETAHLPRIATRLRQSIETLQPAHAGPTLRQSVPEGVAPHAERADHTDAGDHDGLGHLSVALPLVHHATQLALLAQRPPRQFREPQIEETELVVLPGGVELRAHDVLHVLRGAGQVTPVELQPQLADVLVTVAANGNLPVSRHLRGLVQDGLEQGRIDAFATQHDDLVAPASERRQAPGDDAALARILDELRHVADAVPDERHRGAVERGEDELAGSIGAGVDDLEQEAELVEVVAGPEPALHAAGPFRGPVAHEHARPPDLLDELPRASRESLARADDEAQRRGAPISRPLPQADGPRHAPR